MRKIFLSIIMLGAFFLRTPNAMAYNINGWLHGDWKVNPKTGDWIPKSGVFYTVEDYVGPGGYVGPGWGGQRFDAEAMYLDWDDTNLYLALVTGFPRTAVKIGDQYYSAGDIGIDFGVDGTYDYGIEIGGHYPGHYNGLWGGAGNVYGPVGGKKLKWVNGTVFPEANPLYMRKGQKALKVGSVGSDTTFRYNHHYSSPNPGNDHWVVEMRIDKDVFGSDWDPYFRVHWTQNCGNDAIDVTTPEPMSLALFGSGLVGVIFGLRRKKRWHNG